MGTGSYTKEEILQDVTYVKIDTASVGLNISNLPYEGPPDCKIYWKDKELEIITNDLNEAINIISKAGQIRYKIEIYSWHDGERTTGKEENYIRNKDNDLYDAICIISQLGTQKYK